MAQPEFTRSPSFEGAGDPGAPKELYADPHWYACRTNPRAEKKAARLLESAGFEWYLPLVEQERQWSDRTKTVHVPIFPGYVFARFRLSELGRILAQPPIANVASPTGYPTPIRDEVMESVRRMVDGVNETGELPRHEDYLVTGDEVVVTDGPFEGMSGVLVEERGSARVAVHVEALRQATSVEVPRDRVRRRRPGKG